MNERSAATRRRFINSTIATLLSSVAIACVVPGIGETVASKEAGEGGIVKLQKMAWGSALEKDAIEKGLALFMQQQPKVQVEYLHQPDAYDDKLQAMLAGGMAPDVFKVAGNLYADYISSGALMDISDRIKSDPILGKADYFIQPFERERSTFMGKWYGIGSTAQEQVLFYNIELLKQAGVEPPPVDPDKAWPWTDFQQNARRLTVRTSDVAQRVGAHWPSATYGPAVVSNGGKVIDPATLRYSLDQPEAVDAIQRIADLTLKDQVSARATDFQGTTDIQRFGSGNYAMWVSGNWQLLDIAPLKLKFGAAPLPKLKRPATTMTSSTTSIWKDTKKSENSWLLFQFLNSDAYQLPLVQKGLWNPSHTSLLNQSGTKRWLDPTVHPEGYERLVTDYMVKFGYVDVPVIGIRKASLVLNEGLGQIWAGKAGAGDVLRDVVARANKVLDEEQARFKK